MSERYPTDAELKKIKNWDYELGFKSLVDYIESIWWMPDWGFKLYKGRDHLFKNKRVIKLQLHTGGWSGNEEIIGALQQNFMFWSLSFYKHIAGGHFWFEIKSAWLPQKGKESVK